MQEQWRHIYADPMHKKMLFPTAPAGAGKRFLEYLNTQQVPLQGNLLDIGCGNGRNALALAQLGFEVYGFDGIAEAISDAQSSANEAGLADRTHFNCSDAGNTWPYADGLFQFAIDSNTFASLSEDERAVYLTEITRVLAPGAFFFLYTYTIQDQYYAQFLDSGQQLDIGTKIVCTDDGIERILYTPEELCGLFSRFTIRKQEDVVRYSKMFDTYYKRHFAALVMTKDS